jgi:hypothetical protein
MQGTEPNIDRIIGEPQKESRWRNAMKSLMAGAALAALLATPALADFYIVQEPTTKRCRIVEQRPAPGVGVVVGERGFGVRVDAETHMRTVEICKETTGSGGVRIEERERVRER